MVKVLQNRNLCVTLDRNKVIPHDPGADTPVMVCYNCKNYQAYATYWCAVGAGDLEISKRGGGFHKLTQNQIDWLDSLEPEITKFLYD